MLVNVVKYGSYPTPGNEDHSQKSSKYKDKKKKKKLRNSPVHGYILRTILDLFQVNIDIYSAEASFKKEG